MAGTNPDLVIRVAANIAALQSDMAAAVATLKAIEGAATDTAAATTQLASSTDGLGGSWVTRIAEGVLLRDAIREVLSAVEELAIGIPNEAKELRNLSLQTQISIEDLQVVTAATREFGVEGDQLGRALFQLSQRIAGGDANVATAYHLMGLSLDEVRDKSPVDLLMATEQGLGTLSGAIQDTAAKDLYGARLGASMIAFSHGADDAIAKARELNTVASKESVLAAAAYADAIDRATHSVHAWVMELEGASAQGFNTLTDAADKGASKWALFAAMFTDFTNSGTRVGASAEALATLLDHLNQTTAAGKDITLASAKAHDTVTVALTAQQQAAKFMAATELDSAKPLLDWQVEYLGHLKEIGLLTAQNAAGIGVTADQLKNYEAGLASAKKAAEELTKAEAAADALALGGYEKRIAALKLMETASKSAYGFAGQIANLQQLDLAEQGLARTVFNSLTSEKDRAKVVEESINRHIDLMNQETALEDKQAKVVNAAIVAELDAHIRRNAALGLDVEGYVKVTSAAETLRLKLIEIEAHAVAGVSQAEQVAEATDTYTKSLFDEAVAQDAAYQAMLKANDEAAKVPALLAAATAATISFNTPMGAGASSASSTDPQLQSYLSQGYTLNEAMAIAGGYGENVLGHPGAKAAAQAQAGLTPHKDGGPVSEGPAYLHNNEYVVPSGGALVMRDGGGGSGAGVSITNHIYVNGTAADVARQVAAEIMRTANAGRKFPSA